MAKDAYYFSHDANARRDPKIIAMRTKYDGQGYGWYWMLIEMMRESEDYTLPYKKYFFIAASNEFGTSPEQAEQFVIDCIETYELFKVEGSVFYSESFMKRMEIADSKRRNRQESGRIGGLKSGEIRASVKQNEANRSNTQAMLKQNEAMLHENEAILKQNEANPTKGKERKGKEIKEKTYFENLLVNETFIEFIESRNQSKKPPSEIAIKKLVNRLNELSDNPDIQIEIINRSIMNGWAGLFELNRPNGNQQTFNTSKPSGVLPADTTPIKKVEKWA